MERRSTLPADFYNQMLFSLTQVYFTKKDYPKTVPYTPKSKEAKPEADRYANMLLAQSHFFQNYVKALECLQLQFDNINPCTTPVKNGWVKLMIWIRKELGQLEKAEEFINSSDDINTRTKYCLWLANTYREIEKNEKMQSLRKGLVDQWLAGYKMAN